MPTNECAIRWSKGEKIVTIVAPEGSRLKNDTLAIIRKAKSEGACIVAENADGSILAHVPIKYIRVGNWKPNLTDEEKRLANLRWKKAHQSKIRKE